MDRITAEIDGRTVTLSNLDKPMYPNGFTKGEVIDYYLHVGPVILPHLHGRVVTQVRFPDGSGGVSFFEKNASPGLPSWIPRRRVDSPDSSVDYVLAEDRAALAVLANLAAIELHTPQWRAPDGFTGTIDLTSAPPLNDQLVVDLDPGQQTTMAHVARAALLVAARLADDGIVAVPKTSGGKGLQLLAPIAPTSGAQATAYVRAVGAELTAAHPHLLLIGVSPAARVGKVFIDYNQNQTGRNTVSLYSLRAGDSPAASTPLTWDEVGDALEGAPLRFSPSNVLDRVERAGDLAAELFDTQRPSVPQVTAR